jgi:competence protein ComEC
MKMVKNEELKIDSLFVSYDYPLKGKPAKWRKEFEDLNEDIKIPISKKHRGDTIWDFAPFTAKVLWPMQNSPSDTGDAASMVVHLVGGEKSFLFMGDLYSAQEKELLKLDKNLETHALQVGHHGSKSSSSKRFLEQLNPQKAYISTGKCYHILHKDSTKNCYGLPNDEAIKRLRDIIPDSNIFRTDKFGSVGFEMEF